MSEEEQAVEQAEDLLLDARFEEAALAADSLIESSNPVVARRALAVQVQALVELGRSEDAVQAARRAFRGGALPLDIVEPVAALLSSAGEFALAASLVGEYASSPQAAVNPQAVEVVKSTIRTLLSNAQGNAAESVLVAAMSWLPSDVTQMLNHEMVEQSTAPEGDASNMEMANFFRAVTEKISSIIKEPDPLLVEPSSSAPSSRGGDPAAFSFRSLSRIFRFKLFAGRFSLRIGLLFAAFVSLMAVFIWIVRSRRSLRKIFTVFKVSPPQWTQQLSLQRLMAPPSSSNMPGLTQAVRRRV